LFSFSIFYKLIRVLILSVISVFGEQLRDSVFKPEFDNETARWLSPRAVAVNCMT